MLLFLLQLLRLLIWSRDQLCGLDVGAACHYARRSCILHIPDCVAVCVLCVSGERGERGERAVKKGKERKKVHAVGRYLDKLDYIRKGLSLAGQWARVHSALSPNILGLSLRVTSLTTELFFCRVEDNLLAI